VARPSAQAGAGTGAATSGSPKLIIKMDSLTDGVGGSSVAFPLNELMQVQALLTPQTLTDAFQSNALAQGGYLVNGAHVLLNLQTKSASELSISDVKPVNVVRQPMVTGAEVDIPSQGDLTFQMQFNLMDPNPIAQNAPSDPDAGQPFFDFHHIGVSATNGQELDIYFSDLYGAYTFDIEIDYDLDGQQASTIVEDNGQPFRTTAGTCPAYDFASALTPTQLAYDEGQRYQNVLKSNGVIDASGNVTLLLQTVNPDDATLNKCNDVAGSP
jgi:hypothetical protein